MSDPEHDPEKEANKNNRKEKGSQLISLENSDKAKIKL